MEKIIEHANAIFAAVVALQILFCLIPSILYIWFSKTKSPMVLGLVLGALHLLLMALIALAALKLKEDMVWIGLCIIDLPITLLFRQTEKLLNFPLFFLVAGTGQYFVIGFLIALVFKRWRGWRMRKTAAAAATAALLLLIPFPAHAAGICAHAEMGQRAWDKYLVHEDAILPSIAAFRADDEVMRAFYSGCAFPDFAYEGINQDASEYSHWYPYVNAYLEYLRDNYPPPWDQDAMKHVAFFFGLLCHNAGDWPWHFNEGENKSLTTAFVDRYGYDAADYTSDIFAHTLFTIRPSIKGHFWWPREEAYTIFVMQEVKVTQDEVARGCRKLEGEWQKGATFGPIVYPVFQWKYPWMRAHMDDYYFGGIDHDAALVAQCIRYAYAKLHGWHFYQNISLREILFPDKKPFLPMQPPLEVLRAMPKAGTMDNADDESTLRIDLSAIESIEDIHEASLWLRTTAQDTEGQNNVVVHFNGNDAIAPIAESTPKDTSWKRWDITPYVKQWISAPETNKGITLTMQRDTDPQTLIPTFCGPSAMKPNTGEYGGTLVALRPMLVVK